MDGKCIACSGVGVGGRTACVSPCFAFGDYKSHSQVNFASLKCPPKKATFLCNASFNGPRRNHNDLPRNNNHSFSRGRNRQREERDGLENLDESDMFHSRNGPLLSLSGSPKSQATAMPGPREKEIVELFRKVQAKLRERAAVKEEKKAESAAGKGKESETVDSLLKLLRKHSVEQSKRNPSSGGSSKNLRIELPDQQVSFDSVRDEEKTQAPNPSSNRPPSSFKRKSPVPQVKYEPIYQSKQEVPELIEVEPEPELEEFEPEPELEEVEAEPENVIPDGTIYSEKFDGGSLDSDGGVHEDEVSQEEMGLEGEDLSALKLTELRALAKSRGLKGFSKMKKLDLLEVLGGSSV